MDKIFEINDYYMSHIDSMYIPTYYLYGLNGLVDINGIFYKQEDDIFCSIYEKYKSEVNKNECIEICGHSIIINKFVTEKQKQFITLYESFNVGEIVEVYVRCNDGYRYKMIESLSIGDIDNIIINRYNCEYKDSVHHNNLLESIKCINAYNDILYEGVSKIWDNVFEPLIDIIMEHLNDSFVDAKKIPTPYAYFYYYDSETHTKNVDIGLYDEHKFKGADVFEFIMNEYWHRIIFRFEHSNVNYYMKTSRLMDFETVGFDKEYNETLRKMNPVEITINVDAVKKFDRNKISELLQHELTHVHQKFGNVNKDVTVTRFGLIANIKNEFISYVKDDTFNKVKTLCYLSSKYEYAAFAAQAYRMIMNIPNNGRIDTFLKDSAKNGQLSIHLMKYTASASRYETISKLHNYVGDAIFDNEDDRQYILLLAYYINKHKNLIIDSPNIKNRLNVIDTLRGKMKFTQKEFLYLQKRVSKFFDIRYKMYTIDLYKNLHAAAHLKKYC